MLTLIFYLQVYVENIVVITSNPQVIDHLITNLSNAFPVKDLGSLSYFLGVEEDHTPTGLLLSQRKYIKNLLLKTNMLFAQPVSSLMAASLKLSKFDTPEFEDFTLYHSIVGGLQH